jgi:hypothetical protein
MTDLRDAARQALEALEAGAESWRLIGPAIDALRAALEQPEQCMAHGECFGGLCIYPSRSGQPEQPEQEPVAWACFKNGELQTELVGTEADVDFWCASDEPEMAGMVKGALYTHPPRREPLSDEELDRLWREPMSADWEHREFARAVEAAHGIKENT